MVLVSILIVTLLAIAYVAYNFFTLRKMDEGTSDMANLASIIRTGARTFMRAEYRIIIRVIAIVAVIFTVFIEKTSGITFIIGACMSSLACVIGMRSATYANVRTANVARVTKSIGKTNQVALRGGSISGISVQAFGLMGIVAILLIFGLKTGETGGGFVHLFDCNPHTMRLTTYSLGCSLVALFNRVAGGNYTKAADISADIVAKVRHDLPEDDSRMPNTIADFIGDNVNDIAGNCSDLCESFVATVIACILISIASLNGTNQITLDAMTIFPIIIAGVGLIASVVGISFVLIRKASNNPSKELDIATYIAAGAIVVAAFVASRFIFGKVDLPDSFKIGWISPWITCILGIVSGVAVGKITEYYTSTDYKPVKSLAKMAVDGVAFLVTKGDAIGSRSCLLPIGVITLSLVVSGLLCGTYGIAVAALGMLSFVGTTVSIDAFGPISDNAGGIAESCHLEEDVRQITDKLDAVGNTTAAIGKGFAIGSAAFATVSLIIAYVSNYSNGGTPVLNIANFAVIAGAILGGAIIEYFSAMLTDNTIESAQLMAEEGDRQLSIPGVIEGTKTPDYDKCIQMAANQALKKMSKPSILMLIIPAIGGIIFGVEFVGGILVGATIVAIPRAIFMGNSGGAFDNTKKFIESGQLPGHLKHSEAHKTAVMGDTIGDTRKDVVGVALDIAIKLMSTVANTLAPLFASFHIL